MTRPLYVIAEDIKANWPNVNFAAVPYLEAMLVLTDTTDVFGAESAKSIVLYFLSNSSTWRGDTAKRVKAELKAMVK